jgi:hypothetical protein
MKEIKISLWDAIITPEKHLVITIPPIPCPRGIVIDKTGVLVVTKGLPVRLNNSCNLPDVVRESVSIVIAEAHEHITRETLVRYIDKMAGNKRTKNRERNRNGHE